jgi:hypothetical protein
VLLNDQAVVDHCRKPEEVTSYHKYRWNAEKRLGMDLFTGNAKLKSCLLFGQGVWPTGRYLRPANALNSRHVNHQSSSGDGR